MRKYNIQPPEIYLGGRLAKKSLDSKDIWNIYSVDYVKGIIKNVELIMIKEGIRLPRRAETPMSSDYTPELNVTNELESDGINIYMCNS